MIEGTHPQENQYMSSRFPFRAICVGAVMLMVLAAPRAFAAHIFVAGSDPKASDKNPGTEAKPLKTIQKAASLATAGDTVLIRAGTYRETVTPAHSGSNGAPITYMPYNNEKVVIDGADPITNWTNYSGSVYQAPMNWSLNGGDGDQVFVDGQMMNYARYPNTSLDVSNPTRITADTITNTSGGTWVYKAAALDGFPVNYWAGATIHTGETHNNLVETSTVLSSSPGSVTFTTNLIGYNPAAHEQFYLTGKLCALDASGEWFRDPTTNTLYLWTPTGDSPSNHVVEAKARTYGFELSGRSYVTIQGLNLLVCSINTSSASTHNTINGIQALYVSHFERAAPRDGNLWLLHMEDTGIIIRGSNNILENSEIGFSAGNGVLLQGKNTSFSTGNVVTNNVIHDVDYAGVDCAGINAGAWWWNAATSTFNTISYNTIYNSGRDLIVFRNLASGRIVHNHLYNAGLQTDDGGALYTYSQNGKAFNDNRNPATVIAYNHISNDLTAYVNQSSFNYLFVVGIYLDDKSTNYVVHHNLVYGMSDAVFLNAGSPNNLIFNNTLLGVGTNSLVRIASLEARGDRRRSRRLRRRHGRAGQGRLQMLQVTVALYPSKALLRLV